jgi:hypothetical protein
MQRRVWLAAIFLLAAGKLWAQVPRGVPPRLWDDALAALLLGPDDLHLRTDYVARDAARLPVVDRAMHDPTALPGWLAAFADSVFPARFSTAEGAPSGLAALIAPERLLPAPVAPEGEPNVAIAFPRSVLPMLRALEVVNGRSRADSASPVGVLPDSVRALLQEEFPQLLWEDETEEFRSAEWQDSVQQAEEQIARRMVGVLPFIPRARIFSDGILITDRFQTWSNDTAGGDFDRWLSTGREHPRMEIVSTPAGRVAFGTAGADVYRGKFAFILDPGGDDTYELEYDPAHPSRIIIDLEGNDRYLGLTDAALAAGLWGTQILCDLAGNDTYQAAKLDLGAGMFGWGLLIDRAGDDVYSGDTFVQGAGAFGLGLLVDSAGNDTYRAALFAQGFGFTGGAGALVDRRGNDSYAAGGKYNDVLRYVDHYISLSQGFAYGIRPFLSGGVGLLLDAAGNDDYSADIFGQGASYWWGLGGLWDGGGNDHYFAFQYAQGSATHMTAGLLVDEAGDDVYFSKGVSQGCGHDLAAGLLWDLGGNDVYTAYDLSQGAGSANGTGVLFDASGDDRYYVHSRLNTQGYGNPRRDYGSIGLFLDGGGADRYDGPGADSTWWRIDSQWGVGIDYSPAAGEAP